MLIKIHSNLVMKQGSQAIMAIIVVGWRIYKDKRCKVSHTTAACNSSRCNLGLPSISRFVGALVRTCFIVNTGRKHRTTIRGFVFTRHFLKSAFVKRRRELCPALPRSEAGLRLDSSRNKVTNYTRPRRRHRRTSLSPNSLADYRCYQRRRPHP